MKKLVKKLSFFALAAIMTVTMCVVLTACGEEKTPPAKEAVITGVYTSNSIQFFSAYPNWTYKQLTVASQTVTLYDDGSYVLSVTQNMLSGALNFPDVATPEDEVSYNNRGVSVTNYYGTYTSSEEEGLLDLKLEKPTAVRYTSKINQQGYVNGYFDSENWTDAMGELMATTGDDGVKVNMTKEAFLAGYAFNAVETVVDKAAGGFEYMQLTVGDAA